MDLHAILIRSPVNQLAAKVASQRNSSLNDIALTKDDLSQIVVRLQRKHRLLKQILGIKNKSQHKNSMWRANKNIPQFRYEKEPRALCEYKLIGLQIHHLSQELAEIRKAKKAAHVSHPLRGRE